MYRGTQAQSVQLVWEGQRVEYTYWTQYVDGGFWFVNSNWKDATSGIWYYDNQSQQAHPYIQVFDPHDFRIDDWFFYFYDRLSSELLKANVKTREVLWRVPLKRGFGTFELALRGDRVFAAGESGYIVAVQKDGRLLAERIEVRNLTNEAALPGVCGRQVFQPGPYQVV